MNIETLMQERYTTKKYNPNRKISKELLYKLITLLRLTPTSINSQPYHFVVAESQEAKNKIATSMHGLYQNNSEKVIESSHSIIICSKTNLDMNYLQKIIDQEEQDKRFASPANKKAYSRFCEEFLKTHHDGEDHLLNWMIRQCYIALGTLLISAAALGIDSTPMEGFDTHQLDQVLNLHEHNVTSLVVVSLGYRAEDDYNSTLAKSRLPQEQLFTLI